MALPALHNLRLGDVVRRADDVGRSLDLNLKLSVPNAEGEIEHRHQADAHKAKEVPEFEPKEVALERLENLINDLKTKGDVVEAWRVSLCKNLKRKQDMYEAQVNGFRVELQRELERILGIFYAARQDVSNVLSAEEPDKSNTANAREALVTKDDKQPFDVVDTGRWELLVSKIASLKKLMKAIRERQLIVIDDQSWRGAVANFVNVLSRLNDYPDQSGLLQKIVDLVRAFIRNPAIASNQFYNVVIMGVAGTGKTRLAGILGNIMAQIGLYVHDQMVEANVGDFIAGYVGQTENKVSKFLSINAEKVVFLDEAYALTQWNEDHTYLEGYSPQAVAELIAYLSKHVGKIAFIAAGYEDKMTEDFLPANEGLSRRFPIRATLGDYGVETLFQIFARALALTFMEPEPTGRDEKRDWEVRLAEKTKKCANLFDDSAILLLYDVISASRIPYDDSSGDEKTEEEGKDDARPCDDSQESLRNAVVAMQDVVSTLMGEHKRRPKKHPFASFVYPRLAQFFSAQAGAMTNLAGIASTLLIANEKYTNEDSLDTLSVDRNGMYEILLTMIETTFTGKDDAPSRGWIKPDMTARDAAHAELLAVLKGGRVKYTNTNGESTPATWIKEDPQFQAPPKQVWTEIDEKRALAPSPEAAPLMRPADVIVNPGTQLDCPPRTAAELRSGTAIPQTQALALRDSAVRRLEGERDSWKEQHEAAERRINALIREVEALRQAARGNASAAGASSATLPGSSKRGRRDDGDLGGEDFAFVDERFGGITYVFTFYDKEDKMPNANEIDNMEGRFPESRRGDDEATWNTWLKRLERAKAAYVNKKRIEESGSKRSRRDKT